MPLSFSRLMPIPDFPFSRDASVRFLPWIIGGLSFLAALLLFACVSMQSQLSASRHHMSHQITVHIPANLDVPQGLLIDHVQESLKSDARVTNVRQVPADELRQLVSPWLGTSAAASDALPLPVLLEVQLSDDATKVGELMQTLQSVHRNIRVQSYGQWLEDYLGTLRMMQMVSFGLALLLLAVSFTVITFAARMSLMLHQPAINLLHSFGATADYIARQFQWHATQLAMRGAIPGILLAIALFVGAGIFLHAPEGERLLPDLRFSPWHLLFAFGLLASMGWVAHRAARGSVLHGLRRPHAASVPAPAVA